MPQFDRLPPQAFQVTWKTEFSYSYQEAWISDHLWFFDISFFGFFLGVHYLMSKLLQWWFLHWLDLATFFSFANSSEKGWQAELAHLIQLISRFNLMKPMDPRFGLHHPPPHFLRHIRVLMAKLLLLDPHQFVWLIPLCLG